MDYRINGDFVLSKWVIIPFVSLDTQKIVKFEWRKKYMAAALAEK